MALCPSCRNSVVGPFPAESDPNVGDSRGRYDTVGSTIYLADSRACAYAEVLMTFRKDRAAISRAAASIGWDINSYIEQILEDASNNGIDPPWGISVDWQMARSVYEIRLPLSGWWVQIDHPDTLAALETHLPAMAGHLEEVKVLTAGNITGEDRDLTTLIAHTIRQTVLDDGSEPLGISYQSKTLHGRCWAYWDRRADANLPADANRLLQLTSENVGPDPEFERIAKLYRLPIRPVRDD